MQRRGAGSSLAAAALTERTNLKHALARTQRLGHCSHCQSASMQYNVMVLITPQTCAQAASAGNAVEHRRPTAHSVAARGGGCTVFGYCDSCVRSKGWRCRKCGMQATGARRGDHTGVTRPRQPRHSFSRAVPHTLCSPPLVADFATRSVRKSVMEIEKSDKNSKMSKSKLTTATNMNSQARCREVQAAPAAQANRPSLSLTAWYS